VRVALLSDIHANLEAFEACLAHARERGAGAYALLGDFVGYGADAVAVVDTAMRLAGSGAVVLKGNHDAAIERADSYFNDDARAALDWARTTLSDDQKRFLAALPLTVERAPAMFVHASAVGYTAQSRQESRSRAEAGQSKVSPASPSGPRGDRRASPTAAATARGRSRAGTSGWP